jgi:DEAD/DEAH box helicase domain-containing protein
MPTFPAFVPANFQGDVTLDHVIPASDARFSPLPDDLRPELARALAVRGVERLYSHQADAYNAVRRAGTWWW